MLFSAGKLRLYLCEPWAQFWSRCSYVTGVWGLSAILHRTEV